MLIVSGREAVTNEPLLPWLTEMGFGLGEVTEDLVEIVALPDGFRLIGSEYWPAICSLEFWLEGEPELGHDVVADIDPDTGEMSVRPHWWLVE